MPYPVSVNNSYGNKAGGKGRFKTKKARAFEVEALQMLALQKPLLYGDALVQTEFVWYPKKRGGRRDGDNLEKIVNDVLQKAGIVNDDKQIVRCLRTRGRGLPNGGCLLLGIQALEQSDVDTYLEKLEPLLKNPLISHCLE